MSNQQSNSGVKQSNGKGQEQVLNIHHQLFQLCYQQVKIDGERQKIKSAINSLEDCEVFKLGIVIDKLRHAKREADLERKRLASKISRLSKKIQEQEAQVSTNAQAEGVK